MVAAYIIGYSVTSDFLAKYQHLKFAAGAEDAGVIVSWNTEGPGNSDSHNSVLLPGAISINPINWKLDDTYADKCLEAAKRSYAFLVANPDDKPFIQGDFKTGGYQTSDPDDRLWAAAEQTESMLLGQAIL